MLNIAERGLLHLGVARLDGNTHQEDWRREVKRKTEKQSTEVSDAAILKDLKSFVIEGKIHRYIVICNGSYPKHTRASHVLCTHAHRAHVHHTHTPTHRSKQIHNTSTHM